MKKLIVLIAVLLAALFVAGCASTAPTANDLMSGARGDVPPGTLVGQATAASVQQAEQRAKLQIVNGLISIVSGLVADQTGSTLQSSVASEFETSVRTALGRSSLSGAVKVGSGADTTKAKTGWAVYYMDKGEALKEVTNAVNAAKELVRAGNFNPSQGFDAKYNAAAARNN